MAKKPPPEQLFVDGVAHRLGLARATVFRYRYRPSLRFPAPDGRVKGRPWWFVTTIDAWNAGRVGTGYRTDLHQ
jgi:hypothetical protein